MAAGVIIATPPGGSRGSIAVVFVLFELPPPVTLPELVALDPLEPVIEPEFEFDPVCEADAEPEFVFDCELSDCVLVGDCDDCDCCVEDACCADEPCCCRANSAAGFACSRPHGQAAERVRKRRNAERIEVMLLVFIMTVKAHRPLRYFL